MRRNLFAAALLFCLSLPGYAQEGTSAPEAVIEPYDEEAEEGNDHTLLSPDELATSKSYRSQELEVRKFDEQKWKEVVNGVDYQEHEEKRKKQQASVPWAGKALKIFSFVVIGALLITVIYYVTRHISLGFKIERTSLDTENAAAPVEDIAELDIDQLLDQAIRDGNHKLAVRLYYLGLLKKLNEKGAIVWKKDKTNRDYLTELFSANIFFDDVRRLTLSYESVWYGDHDLKSETFQSLTAQFENIYGKINTEKI